VAQENLEQLSAQADPQAAYSIDLVGTDPAALALPPPPCFASRAMAAEMIELYWRALMRDVPFRDYQSSPVTRAAIRDLVAAGFPRLAEATLFRGEAAVDRRRPFLSQFFWRDWSGVRYRSV
jgi:hypothetical protein